MTGERCCKVKLTRQFSLNFLNEKYLNFIHYRRHITTTYTSKYINNGNKKSNNDDNINTV